MSRYAAGDDTAFLPLFALLAPRIRAFFVRSFADVTLAESLMMRTFRRMRQGRRSFRPDIAPRAWVFGFAAIDRRDELQRRYGLAAAAGEAELVQAESRRAVEPLGPVVNHGHDCGVEAARDAIARLPESQRVVLHLHTQEELTFEQIAGVLGTTPEAVRDRARVAYERLRCELRRYLTPIEVAQ
jgi:RNA polymerase sigma-70 factor (ECF subfamily)